METRTERIDAMRGGKGHVILKHLLSQEEFKGKCRLYAQITLEPDCSIGYHEHHNENETFYILSGKGIYNDNGNPRSITTGDVAYNPNGSGHSIENTGDDDLVFMALIILEK